MSFIDRGSPFTHNALFVLLLANVTVCAVWINLRHAAEVDRQARADLEAKLSATGRVVSAIKDVQPGQEISRSALVEREIPQMRMPMDAITSVDLLVGRTAKYGLERGAIVSQHDVAPQGSLYYYERLPPGMRAVSFQVDDTTAGSALIEPDSFIDIYATAGSGAQTKTVPILTHAKVLAVGSALNKYDYEQSKCPRGPVTVGVTPQQADKLLEALASTNVYLRSLLTVRANSMRLK
jgi:pilus assembly protein CpaB